MSTPISNIQVQGSSSNQEEDPEVTAILKEMHAPQQQNPVQNIPIMQQPIHNYQPQYNPSREVVTKKELIDTKLLQRAAIASVIAYIMFYPATLEMVYQKVPMFQKLATYDSFIRFLLLAVVLYILMWKFDI